jgi:hypothetical protein
MATLTIGTRSIKHAARAAPEINLQVIKTAVSTLPFAAITGRAYRRYPDDISAGSLVRRADQPGKSRSQFGPI